MVRSILLSFTNENLLYPGHYVGMENYRYIVDNGGLVQSLIVTLIYVAAVSTVSLAIGLIAALVVEQLRSSKLIARTLLTLPWVVPTLVTALLFAYIFSVHTGIINSLLSYVGLHPRGWLTNNTLALVSVSLVTAWYLFPFAMLVLLAAIQSVSSELYEAASLDGASYRIMAQRITIPAISPTIRIVALFLVIWAFQQFQIIWILTEGGPINGTNVLIINLYKTGFVSNNIGQAAAIGVIGLVLSALITTAFFLMGSPMKQRNAS